jgi:hypothetical protein
MNTESLDLYKQFYRALAERTRIEKRHAELSSILVKLETEIQKLEQPLKRDIDTDNSPA